MWILLTLLVFIIILVFRRQIARKPRLSAGLFGGLLAVILLLKVFRQVPGYASTPKWIIVLGLIIAFIWATKLFRETVNKVWPPDRRNDHDV